MPYTNIHRGARISPKKAKLVTDLIRGRHVDEALTILSMSTKRGAVMVKNALNAAIANADKAEADVRRLMVKVAKVDGGPTIKRFQPKDRGRAHPIMKRTSHITVTVDESSEA
ncbi:50S ribosomal protein L22 [Mucisphaera calidilacus]|uniref:Large ribosomal subunit protein uL22 n=1 Tax=Mucisphaera calidilacus TaxID=2527982 RepID=A0A518BXS2_9BACT|nr:50S ribosomal protein L22 [Mucisphaera calidilacus]QDU71771.1 50S ribosomal protein L22 [Mucisphaera calidilacus]